MHPVILLLLSSIITDWVWLLIFTRFLDHTQRLTTVGRTPLNEWSVRRRDLYLTTHNNHNRQTSMPPPRRAEDFYLPLKIRRLRPGLNPRTWVPKASTLPLDHRSRYHQTGITVFCKLWYNCGGIAPVFLNHQLSRGVQTARFFLFYGAQPGTAHSSHCGLMIRYIPVCGHRLFGEKNWLHLHSIFSCNTWCVVLVTFTRF